MMKKVLVAYATFAGSTVKVAQAVAEESTERELQVDILPLGEVKGLEGYDALVVGGPMILGWHREAFQRIPLGASGLGHVLA